jgi:hypothetical protein
MGKRLVGLLCIFLAGTITGFLGTTLVESRVERVRLVRDIDLEVDSAFSKTIDTRNEPPGVLGLLKRGSIGTVDMRKGSVVYLHFGTALLEKDVETID